MFVNYQCLYYFNYNEQIKRITNVELYREFLMK